MILTPQEFRDIYDALVSKSGHPDPMGYMARIMLTSGGDPDYMDSKGRHGLMPTTPEYAKQLVGSSDVVTLEGNIMTTLAMDSILFDRTGTLEAMINFFHSLGNVAGNTESHQILKHLEEATDEMEKMIHPPIATFKDVVDFLSSNEPVDSDIVEAFRSII